MTVLPIAERELRVSARRRATYWVRTGLAGVAVFAGFCIFVFSIGLPADFAGRRVFEFLAGLLFLYCLSHGRRSTADCLSQEKREGTLGLLFLTSLKGYDVVLGKVAATSFRGLYVVMAILPV